MISIASTIPSAFTTPPGLVPGGASDAPQPNARLRSLAPPSGILERAQGRERSRASKQQFRELARYIPEMESSAGEEGDSAQARARASAVIKGFSAGFMTQLISQSMRGPAHPQFDATHEQGFAAYQAANERGTTNFYGLLDPLSLAA
jgi:hypothetical protein